MNPHYPFVIIGGGQAGAAAIEGIRAHDRDGRILLVKRVRPPEAGCWSLPGGKVDEVKCPVWSAWPDMICDARSHSEAALAGMIATLALGTGLPSLSATWMDAAPPSEPTSTRIAALPNRTEGK